MYYNHRKVKKAEDDQALMGRILRHMGFKLRETKTSYPKWVRENVRITLNTISDASQPDGKLFGIWVDNRWIKDVSSVEECIRLLQEYVDPLVLWGGVLQYLPDFDMGGMVVKEGVFNELYKSTVMRLLLENYDPMERIGALNMHPDDVSTVVGLALTGDSKKVETKFNTLIMETIKRLSQEDAIAKAVEWGLVEGPNPDRIMFKEFDQFFADPTELVRYILERKEVMVMGGGGFRCDVSFNYNEGTLNITTNDYGFRIWINDYDGEMTIFFSMPKTPGARSYATRIIHKELKKVNTRITKWGCTLLIMKKQSSLWSGKGSGMELGIKPSVNAFICQDYLEKPPRNL